MYTLTVCVGAEPGPELGILSFLVDYLVARKKGACVGVRACMVEWEEDGGCQYGVVVVAVV